MVKAFLKAPHTNCQEEYTVVFGKPRSNLKVVVFDMDGVLVDVRSSWQFVHEAFGKDNATNLEKYRDGRMTYSQLVRSDIALWGHARLSKIRSILQKAPIMPGARKTLRCLRNGGVKTVLLSAGISILAERLQSTLKIDKIVANEVLADQRGFLTGEGIVRVSLLEKLQALEELSTEDGFSLAECAVVGDSSYDIPMFKRVASSIAFNSDEENVRKSAEIVIDTKDLREILPYLQARAKTGILARP
jgi:phosphoserine phosphatase